MEWLNENSGLLLLIIGVIVVAMLALCIFFVVNLRNSIAVQRLKILGLFAVDFDSRERYAEITVANKSLNEVGIAELGIQNGITNFDLTALYKEKNGLLPESRVVIEQRSAITFRLSSEELKKALLSGEKQPLKKLRFYAIDLTGTLYRGNLKSIKKLLATMLNEQKKGIVYQPELPLPVKEQEPVKEPEQAPAEQAQPPVFQNEQPAFRGYDAPAFEPSEQVAPLMPGQFESQDEPKQENNDENEPIV